MSHTNNHWDKIREKSIETIRGILLLANTDKLEISELSSGNRPVIVKGKDENETYTLDRISVCENTDIQFESLGPSGFRYDLHVDLMTTTLKDIADFLVENKDKILDIFMPAFSKKQREHITDTLNKMLTGVMPNSDTRKAAVERLLPHIFNHIENNASWDKNNTDAIINEDIPAALQAVLADFLDI